MLKTYSVAIRGRIKRFWCSYNTTPDGSLHTRLHTHADTAGRTHTNTCCIRTAWISASPLVSPLIQPFSSHILFNKWWLLLLEISHPALFTDRCHSILATLNFQDLVKRIETQRRFYLVFVAHLRDSVQTKESRETSSKHCCWSFINVISVYTKM